MLLSIIVPFYGVERYIAACLEPLCALPPDRVEVLLVDDCGPDGSRAIADAFCARCPSMRVIERTQNGGLSAARNTGLDAARGEYVFFLDSDDVPEADSLLPLCERMAREELDVIKARFAPFDDDTGAALPAPVPPPCDAMAGDALFARQCRAEVYEPMVWQCIYRRAFLEAHGLRMAEGLLFEDELFQTPALLLAGRAAMSDRTLVRYRQREGSIMRSFARSAAWCASYLEVCRRLSALADGLADTPGRVMLRRRVGQIALSVGKNIPAYGLAGDVRREAVAFLRAHRRELSGFALRSEDASVRRQGILLRASPALFLRLYARLTGR